MYDSKLFPRTFEIWEIPILIIYSYYNWNERLGFETFIKEAR